MPTSKDSTDGRISTTDNGSQANTAWFRDVPRTVCKLDDIYLCIWYGSLLRNNVPCSANYLTGISKSSDETGILFGRNGGA